jgi:hypothetical protein
MQERRGTGLAALRHAAVDVLHEQRLLRGGERFNSVLHFVVGAAGQSPNDSEKQPRQRRRARRLQGGCGGRARRLQGGCGGRCGARGEKQRIGAAGAGAGQPHMMTVVVALFNVSGLREPSGGSPRHMATARSVPIAV